jgi:DNA-binding PadR family transcriptional regulator
MGSQPKWMRGCSPLKGAALALVIERPGHCYGLTNRLNRRLGPAWHVGHNELYRPLKGLAAAELVWSKMVDGNAPTERREVYHPTDRAVPALRDWMGAATAMAPMRKEFEVKLSVAREEDIPALLGALDVYERDCHALLAATSPPLPLTDSLAGLEMQVAREAALRHLRADLEGFVYARSLLSEFLSGR